MQANASGMVLITLMPTEGLRAAAVDAGPVVVLAAAAAAAAVAAAVVVVVGATALTVRPAGAFAGAFAGASAGAIAGAFTGAFAADACVLGRGRPVGLAVAAAGAAFPVFTAGCFKALLSSWSIAWGCGALSAFVRSLSRARSVALRWARGIEALALAAAAAAASACARPAA